MDLEYYMDEATKGTKIQPKPKGPDTGSRSAFGEDNYMTWLSEKKYLKEQYPQPKNPNPKPAKKRGRKSGKSKVSETNG